MQFKRGSAIFFLLFACSMTIYSQNFTASVGGIYGFENSSGFNSKGINVNFNILAGKPVSILMSAGYNKLYKTYGGGNSIYRYPADINPYSYNNLSQMDEGLLDGELSITYLEFAPKVILFENIFSLSTVYAAAGFGLYYPEYEWRWNTFTGVMNAEESEGFRYFEGKMRTNIGFNFRLGVDFNVNDWSRINLETKYLIYKPEINSEIRKDEADTQNNRTVNLNTFFIGASLVLVL